jgi:hypothetical protein
MLANTLIFMVRPAGFEPAAYGFEVQGRKTPNSMCFMIVEFKGFV